MIVLGLKNLLFGMHGEHVCSLQFENADLKFKIKMLELQLNTLKKRKEANDISNSSKLEKMKVIFLELENEICQFIIDRQKVNSRLVKIYSLISLFNSIM